MENEANTSQGMEGDEAEAEMASRRVYQDEQKVADFRKKRVTDSKLKKRIQVPGPVNEENWSTYWRTL